MSYAFHVYCILNNNIIIALAVVCQRSFFNHGVQPWSSFWQSADHAGSRDSDLPFVFFPVETAAGHQKLSDDGCSQDAGTGVRGRSAWLLQQSIIWYQRGPPATSAECTECGSKIHHWCKKIRSHLSCVAWSSLVTSATKDNLQDRHLDAPVLERFGTSLPGDRLYLNLVDARPKTVAICNIRTAIHSKNQDNDVWTKVVQGIWSHSLEWSACQIEGFFSEQKLFQKIA